MNPQSGTKSSLDSKPQITLTELQQKIDAGVKIAIAKAIEKHRKLGESISIWQDGKVITLTADQIPPMKLDNDN